MDLDKLRVPVIILSKSSKGSRASEEHVRAMISRIRRFVVNRRIKKRLPSEDVSIAIGNMHDMFQSINVSLGQLFNADDPGDHWHKEFSALWVRQVSKMLRFAEDAVGAVTGGESICSLKTRKDGHLQCIYSATSMSDAHSTDAVSRYGKEPTGILASMIERLKTLPANRSNAGICLMKNNRIFVDDFHHPPDLGIKLDQLLHELCEDLGITGAVCVPVSAPAELDVTPPPLAVLKIDLLNRTLLPESALAHSFLDSLRQPFSNALSLYYLVQSSKTSEV